MTTRSALRSLRESRGEKERPFLPLAKYNENLASMERQGVPQVKFQPIRKDGHAIVVGRVKVPTPSTTSGHAYVLRRYDTGAISLSTMWKASFPTASSTEEKEEFAWVKKNFSLEGPQETIRLAGIWLPISSAVALSVDYKIKKTVEALAQAQPDVDAILRSQDSTDELTTATPSGAASNKRRKGSPPKSTEKRTRASLSAAAAAATTSTPPRSTRQTRGKTKSPAPPTRSAPPRGVKTRTKSPPTSSGTSVLPSILGTLSHTNNVEEADIEVNGVNADDDIAESKALVQKLKAELDPTSTAKPASKRGGKRARADVEEELPNGKPALKFNLDAVPTDPTEDREIVSNNRVRELVKWRPALPAWPAVPRLEPQQKSAAWGTLAFALAVGASAFVPQLF